MNFGDGEFQLTFPDGSMSLFEPLQLHFHSPSEHTVGGKHHDLEMHIVHQYKGTQGQLGAVIGVFFDIEDGGDAPNAWIEAMNFSGAVPYVHGDDTADPPIEAVFGTPIVNANLASFLGSLDLTRYWSYPGSLTTPPCLEGIKWTVVADVQNISRE